MSGTGRQWHVLVDDAAQLAAVLASALHPTRVYVEFALARRLLADMPETDEAETSARRLLADMPETDETETDETETDEAETPGATADRERPAGASAETASSDADILRHAMAHRPEVEWFAALPRMTRGEPGAPDIADLAAFCAAFCAAGGAAGFAGVLVRTLEALAYLCEADYAGRIVADYGLYLWNHEALAFLSAQETGRARFQEYCLPYELNRVELTALEEAAGEKDLPHALCVYGRAPMMVSANCVRRTAGACMGREQMRGARDGSGNRTGQNDAEAVRTHGENDRRLRLALRDRTGARLPVTAECRYCYNVIWNAAPISLHRQLAELTERLRAAALRLDFTVETKEECGRVCGFFAALSAGADISPPYAAYTTGHYKRGVL